MKRRRRVEKEHESVAGDTAPKGEDSSDELDEELSSNGLETQERG